MTKGDVTKAGTAERYWAACAESHFEAMTSSYQPGERAGGEPMAVSGPEPVSRPVRRGLPPLTPSQTIVDAIAACAQPRSDVEQKAAGGVAREAIHATPITAI